MYTANKMSLDTLGYSIWRSKLNVQLGRDVELNLLIDFLKGGAGGIPNELTPYLRRRQDEHNKEFNALMREAQAKRFDTIGIEKVRVQHAL